MKINKEYSFMKKIVFLLFIILTYTTINAQSTVEVPIQNISSDVVLEYRLFSTNNIYMFIKLNTRNGQMWQVQWGKEEDRMVISIN